MVLSALIVEDDDNFRRMLELRLKSAFSSIYIDHAGTITEAANFLNTKSGSYDFVVLDQRLPDGDGAELLSNTKIHDAAILAVSADIDPELPATALRAGAQHFLQKKQIAEPLFIPLLKALIERKQLEKEVIDARLKKSKMETIKILLATLQHEINNPLGAVLGGTYLIKTAGTLLDEQKDALRLVEESTIRIKHVISKLCETAELEAVDKGRERVFQVPGDKSWNEAPTTRQPQTIKVKVT